MILFNCVPFQMRTSLKGKSLLPEGANYFLYEQFLIVWKITFIILIDLSWVLLFLLRTWIATHVNSLRNGWYANGANPFEMICFASFNLVVHSLPKLLNRPSSIRKLKISDWGYIRIYLEYEDRIERKIRPEDCRLVSRGFAEWWQTAIPRDGFFYSTLTRIMYSFFFLAHHCFSFIYLFIFIYLF